MGKKFGFILPIFADCHFRVETAYAERLFDESKESFMIGTFLTEWNVSCFSYGNYESLKASEIVFMDIVRLSTRSFACVF